MPSNQRNEPILPQHSPFMSRHAWRTYIALAIGCAAWYLLEWKWATIAFQNFMVFVLSVMGHEPISQGNQIIVAGIPVSIIKDCMYGEWMLYAAPLLWRHGRSVLDNLLVIALALLATWWINVLRVYIAIVMHANGTSFFLAHDAPDYVLWYGSMAILIILWIRHMKTHARDLAAI